MQLNILGKLFIGALGAWIVGKATKTKVRGTPEEIRAVAMALASSRRFQEELENDGATVKSVMAKLDVKNMSAKEFERILGVPWPL